MNNKRKSLERYSDILDTKYRIPGTDIRFGLDFIIGLVPGMGDIISFSLSGGLLALMITKGASGRVLSMMLLNLLLDTTLGTIPLVGDIFDLFFKANKRNLDLFQDHFEEGKYQGSAWSVILPVLVVFITLLLVFLWSLYKLLKWVGNSLF